MDRSLLRVTCSRGSYEDPGSAPLLQAAELIRLRELVAAKDLLSSARCTGEMIEADVRGLALMALALLARGERDHERALAILQTANVDTTNVDRATGGLALDLLLARAGILGEMGRNEESCGCARSALDLFDRLGYSLAWSRPVVLGLMGCLHAEASAARRDQMSRAMGALAITNVQGAHAWWTFMRDVFRHHVMSDEMERACDHAIAMMMALPADVLGVDLWWDWVLRFLHKADAASKGKHAQGFSAVFGALEYDFNRVLDYEAAAPLLPRPRTTPFVPV